MNTPLCDVCKTDVATQVIMNGETHSEVFVCNRRACVVDGVDRFKGMEIVMTKLWAYCEGLLD